MIETNRDAKQWGMFVHLAGLLGLVLPGVANLLGPLVLWLIKREDLRFVDDQGKQAVNFQLNLLVYGLIALLLTFVVVGVFLFPLIAVAGLVFPIVAGIEASKGNYYRYPFVLIKFVR
jgi:hypothetical protein